MSTTTRLAGIALIIAGGALGAVSFRLASHDRVQADAEVVAGATAEKAAHEAEELRAAERSARQAAAIEPLAAAVKMNVDNETLADLFDNEDWWRPIKSGEFRQYYEQQYHYC